MRINVQDILSWLASGMSYDEILTDFPELTKADILTALAYSADKERELEYQRNKNLISNEDVFKENESML